MSLIGVVGMEGQRVLRSLSVDPERIVGAEPVQCNEMEQHDTHDQERQQVVQRVEAVQRRVTDREAAPQPGDDALAR